MRGVVGTPWHQATRQQPPRPRWWPPAGPTRSPAEPLSHRLHLPGQPPPAADRQQHPEAKARKADGAADKSRQRICAQHMTHGERHRWQRGKHGGGGPHRRELAVHFRSHLVFVSHRTTEAVQGVGEARTGGITHTPASPHGGESAPPRHASPAGEERDDVGSGDIPPGEWTAPARQDRTPCSIRRLARPEFTGQSRAERTDLARLRRCRSASPTHDV